MTRHRSLIVLAPILLVAVGCSRSDEIASTPTDPVETTTTTVETTTTTVVTTSTSTTTTVVVADTTTTVPETTTTVAPTTAPSSTVPFPPAPEPPALAYAVGDTDLVEVDVAAGSVTRTVIEFFNGDGVFRGNLRLAPDGTTLWFSEGYEDGWYGCDSSIGSVGRIDLASGAVEVIGVGNHPDPSPDGAVVAYRSSEQCLPDPENPELWVLTPYDRVVVRDLETGDERRYVTDPTPDAYGAPSEISWLGFDQQGQLLVATVDGAVRAVDLDGPETLQEHATIRTIERGVVVGATDAGLVVTELGLEGSTDLFLVPESGTYQLMATSEGFMAAGVAPNGAIVVAGFTDVDVQPGAPVTVLTPPDGDTFYDLDW